MGTAATSTHPAGGFPTPGPQSPTGKCLMDQVYFLSNSQWNEAREQGAYDLVIVGSGFCGLAVARRALEQKPFCRILMIERGPFFLPEHFQSLALPFVPTLGGLSETFPWTVSARTAEGRGGVARWQHGMVPFFGGRSTLWSAWCPRPTPDEMAGWPEETIRKAQEYFEAAETMLHVRKADEIDTDSLEDAGLRKLISRRRPVYGRLQHWVQNRLKDGIGALKTLYRSEPASLASAAESVDGIDFQKYSTPGDLLALVMHQRQLAEEGKGSRFDVVSDCIVERVLQRNNVATALETSRGVLTLGDAKLVLAMGTLPPTTLVRNTFPEAADAGKRFSAHFVTSVVARVPAADIDPDQELGDLELAACYVAGIADHSFEQQFHLQLIALHDRDPKRNAGKVLRSMPDVVASTSMAQLESCEGYVVYVCAVVGELDYDNEESWFRHHPEDQDPTTSSLLQVVETERDGRTWDVMDESAFEVLEQILSPQGPSRIEYWHGDPNTGTWKGERPSQEQRRVDALVHESSTLHIGTEASDPVALDYRLRAAHNVYVTGGSLWPQGGSWNPTLTMVALAMDLADRLTRE